MTPGAGQYELRILGAPDLRAPDGRRITSVLAQPARLSLLSYLALAPGPVTRAAVVASFWPESDEAKARNALSQAVFYLRRSLGKDAVQSVAGDRLWVPPETLWCDARELMGDGPVGDEVVDAAADELLAGWNADGSQPLQEWLDGQRRRVRERVAALRKAGALASTEAAQAHPSRKPAVATGGARGRTRWIAALGLAALLALVTVGVIGTLGERPLDARSSPSRIAVLLPRVTPSGVGPSLEALTLNAEIISRLPQSDNLEVVTADFATSLQEFRAQFEALIGRVDEDAPDDTPDWILDVSAVVTADAVHIVGLLYRGAGQSVLASERFDVPFDSAAELAIEVPHAIADRVATMVSQALD